MMALETRMSLAASIAVETFKAKKQSVPVLSPRIRKRPGMNFRLMGNITQPPAMRNQMC
jgi:hypothetical protein